MQTNFQTIHEKQIIGGYESRPSNDLVKNQSSYFLNIFHYSVREAMERADRDGGIRYESEVEKMEKYLDNSALADMKSLGIKYVIIHKSTLFENCLLYTSPSPRDLSTSRMPSSA